ncbi:hypothetical protein D3C74_450400 [compost metagenome]
MFSTTLLPVAIATIDRICGTTMSRPTTVKIAPAVLRSSAPMPSERAEMVAT